MKNNLFHFVRNLSSLSILLILFIFSNTYGQMQKFPMQNRNLTSQSSFLLSAPTNDLLYFWYEGTILNQSRSTDNGAGWSSGSQLVDSLTDADSVRDVNSFATATGRILLIYKKLYYYLKYSDDNGTSWSSANKLSTGTNITARFSYAGNFSQSSSGRIFLVYSKYGSTVQNVYYIASTDNGITWSSQVTVLTGPAYGSIVGSSIGGLTMFYQDKGIYTETSINDGATWQNPVPVIFSDTNVFSPKAIMDQSGKTWLFYVKHIATPFNNR